MPCPIAAGAVAGHPAPGVPVSNYYQDNEDLQYYVDHDIAWDSLVRLVEHELPAADGPKNVEEAVESYRDILNLVGQFTADKITPHVAAVDHAGVTLENGRVKFPPQLDSIFDQIKELGLHAMCLPRELGGMNCPVMMYFLTSELIARGDVSIMTHHGFHGAIAMAMLLYSVGEKTTEFEAKTGRIKSTRFAKEMAEICEGNAWGCMDITEPDAGSDMAVLSTRGEQDKDGRWFVTGQKRTGAWRACRCSWCPPTKIYPVASASTWRTWTALRKNLGTTPPLPAPSASTGRLRSSLASAAMASS
jgi:hypothetical protein